MNMDIYVSNLHVVLFIARNFSLCAIFDFKVFLFYLHVNESFTNKLSFNLKKNCEIREIIDKNKCSFKLRTVYQFFFFVNDTGSGSVTY